MDFGSRIRELRVKKDLNLRDFAQRIGIDFTYLSKIENGKVEPPSEKIIRVMAKELDVDAEELLALAGKFSSEEMRQAVQANPKVGLLLRKLQTRSLTKQQIEQMIKITRGDDRKE